jgi:hypothetical protein
VKSINATSAASRKFKSSMPVGRLKLVLDQEIKGIDRQVQGSAPHGGDIAHVVKESGAPEAPA